MGMFDGKQIGIDGLRGPSIPISSFSPLILLQNMCCQYLLDLKQA